MHDILDYRGNNFFACADWFQILEWTVGLDVVMLRNDVGAIPCRRVGRRLESLTHFYSVEYAPIGRWETLLGQVGHRLDLRYLHDPSIATVLRDHGFHTFRTPQHGNWVAHIDGSFASYFAQRPSQLRNTVKRRSKAIAKDHRLELVVLTKPERKHVADYVEVYDASWKEPEPFPEFIPELIACAAQFGVLRLGIAYLDGEPAAAQLWIVEAGRAVIYKLAYKERFKTTSVGSILSHEMFRHAIDVDGVTLVDYGIGDDAYKRAWMTERREVYQLTCFAPSVKGRLLAGAKRGLLALRARAASGGRPDRLRDGRAFGIDR